MLRLFVRPCLLLICVFVACIALADAAGAHIPTANVALLLEPDPQTSDALRLVRVDVMRLLTAERALFPAGAFETSWIAPQPLPGGHRLLLLDGTQVYHVDVQRGTLRRFPVVVNADAFGPTGAVSPDGRLLAWGQISGDTLYLTDLHTWQTHPLYRSSTLSVRPVPHWSPDGQRLALTGETTPPQSTAAPGAALRERVVILTRDGQARYLTFGEGQRAKRATWLDENRLLVSIDQPTQAPNSDFFAWYDVRSGEELRRVRGYGEVTCGPHAVAFISRINDTSRLMLLQDGVIQVPASVTESPRSFNWVANCAALVVTNQQASSSVWQRDGRIIPLDSSGLALDQPPHTLVYVSADLSQPTRTYHQLDLRSGESTALFTLRHSGFMAESRWMPRFSRMVALDADPHSNGALVVIDTARNVEIARLQVGRVWLGTVMNFITLSTW